MLFFVCKLFELQQIKKIGKLITEIYAQIQYFQRLGVKVMILGVYKVTLKIRTNTTNCLIFINSTLNKKTLFIRNFSLYE